MTSLLKRVTCSSGNIGFGFSLFARVFLLIDDDTVRSKSQRGDIVVVCYCNWEMTVNLIWSGEKATSPASAHPPLMQLCKALIPAPLAVYWLQSLMHRSEGTPCLVTLRRWPDQAVCSITTDLQTCNGGNAGHQAGAPSHASPLTSLPTTLIAYKWISTLCVVRCRHSCLRRVVGLCSVRERAKEETSRLQSWSIYRHSWITFTNFTSWS